MLVSEAAKPFDPESFLEGHMTPIFFGSALRHFGVGELLEGLGAYAPPPNPGAAPRHRPAAGPPPAATARRPTSRRATRRSRASCSRCRRTSIPATATASPSC